MFIYQWILLSGTVSSRQCGGALVLRGVGGYNAALKVAGPKGIAYPPNSFKTYERKQNAQDEDQERCEKTLPVDWYGQGSDEPSQQAARDDQAHQQTDPPTARHVDPERT